MYPSFLTARSKLPKFHWSLGGKNPTDTTDQCISTSLSSRQNSPKHGFPLHKSINKGKMLESDSLFKCRIDYFLNSGNTIYFRGEKLLISHCSVNHTWQILKEHTSLPHALKNEVVNLSHFDPPICVTALQVQKHITWNPKWIYAINVGFLLFLGLRKISRTLDSQKKKNKGRDC